MMTFEERQQKAKQLCEKLVERIGEVAAMKTADVATPNAPPS